MKYVLFVLSLFLAAAATAQKNEIVVKVQNKSIRATPDEDNTGKVLVINSYTKSAGTGKLTIYNGAWQREKDWIRHFEIFDSTDNSIKKLSAIKQGYYQAGLRDLLKLLRKNQNYSLYTMALPADPQKAATVRVRRIFICTIIVK